MTAAGVLTGLAAAPAGAAVGKVTGATPPAVSNATTGSGAPCAAGETLVQFRTDIPFPQGGEPPRGNVPGQGTQVELVRTETDTDTSSTDDDEDTVIGDVVEATDQSGTEDPFVTAACFRFGPGDDGTSPPENPDDYNVYVYVGERDAGAMCLSCFDVFGPDPTIREVRPPQVPIGPIENGQIFAVHGTGYAESTRVDALFPGTQVVDTKVVFTEATEPLIAGQIPLPIDNTATKLSRTISVDRTAVPGFRDLRVLNTDGKSAVAPGGLRLTSIYIDRIEPSAADNTSVVRATLTGRGFPAGSVPSLVDEVGGAVLTATNVVSDTRTATIGTFDLRGARGGTYRVRLVAPDGSSSVPECSPTFTLVDVVGVPGRAGLRRSEFVCRSGGGSGEPGSSPGASPSGSASPRPSTSASVRPTSATSPAPAASVSPSPSTASPPTSPRPSTSASGSPSPSTAPPSGSRYEGLGSPVRVLDTRSDGGQRRSGQIVLDLSDHVRDASATAAVLNVTVTNPTARGHVTAYPHGTARPGTSNVNVEPGQTQANEVMVGMSADDRVALHVESMSAHVIVDLVGVLTSSSRGGRWTVTTPARAFDSRTTSAPRRRGEVVLDLFERLPAGATDAILNVTVTGSTGRGHVTVFPTGTQRPGTSNVNVERGRTQANEVVTRVGTGSNAGRVSLFVDSTEAGLIVDVVGAVTPSGQQYVTALDRPTRALDTRSGPRRSGEVELTMPAVVPASATAVVLNVTSTNGTRPGHVAVYPAGASYPGTSNVNFPGERRATATSPASAGTQANEVVTGLGAGRRVTLLVAGSGSPASHVIVDVVGYLTP